MKKTWAQELVALADRITILNDDDALELLKKTMLSSSASFMEIKVTRASMVKRALSAMHAVKRNAAHKPQLDLIELALHGKQKGFDKVILLTAQIAANLKKELEDNDAKETLL